MLALLRRPLILVPALIVGLLSACGGTDGLETDPGMPAPNPDSGPGGDGQDAEAGHKIVRTASIELSVRDIDSSFGEIRAITKDAGGYVSDSRVTTEADGNEPARPREALVTIQVPSTKFDDVMDSLRSQAPGTEPETTSVSEVTAEYTDLESRVRNLQASEQAYLGLLDAAGSIDEVLRVQQSVNDVRSQIEQSQGRLRLLDTQVDLATIEIKLHAVSAAADDSGWAVQAWEFSWHATTAIAIIAASAAIAMGVISIWLVPLALAGFFFWHRFGGWIVSFARRID